MTTSGNGERISVLEDIQEDISATSHSKGWWETDRSDGEAIVLIHSELSEAVEYLRHGNPASDHIPGFSGVEEELADAVIRIFDLAAERRWDVAGALVAKMEFNKTRPYKHGKVF